MNYNIKKIMFSGLMAATIFSSCVPDRVEGEGNGVTPSNSDASFTVTKLSPNNYRFVSSNNNYLFSMWDMGDDGGYNRGANSFDAFIPDAGTYSISHRIIGQGGVIAGTANQTITVEASDPVAGNLVQGGKFINNADWGKWTINNTGSGANWSFSTPAGGSNSGKATLTATGWAGQGIYQAIPVTAGRKYKIDMVASSTSGCVDTWFEVYCGYNVPVAGQDYSGDGIVYRSINTWDGSGKTPFSGKISVIGEVNPSKNGGIFTATQTGTVYLGIRGGGADMKDGISITNVEFRGMN